MVDLGGYLVTGCTLEYRVKHLFQFLLLASVFDPFVKALVPMHDAFQSFHSFVNLLPLDE